MRYLEQEHSSLRTPAARRSAIDALLEQCLQHSRRFRLEFDAHRLLGALGEETYHLLLPEVSADDAAAGSTYAVYEGVLDPTRSDVLRGLITPDPEEAGERPLNYVRSVRLLDKDAATVFRSGDRNEFILFDLPRDAYHSLLSAYDAMGLPHDVIDDVDIDVERLEP